MEHDVITLHRARLAHALEAIDALDELEVLRDALTSLRAAILAGEWDVADPAIREDADAETVELRRDVLSAEFDQMLAARTCERAQYYLRRLRAGVLAARTGAINDINLARWKEYDDILTDSLWIEPRRDNSGAHLAWYWGNFIPQIPYQMLRRYTRRGEWVLDAFAGSGTTLIECRRLGRNGVGIELNDDVARQARDRIACEPNAAGAVTEVYAGDSRVADLRTILHSHGVEAVQLAVLHPPYHDIIKFSAQEADLSNAPHTEAFLDMFGQVVSNITPLLQSERYLVLVIGDKYVKGEWIPLGFRCMEAIQQRGYLLKSIVVKNFDETRGKRAQKELWRYRALVGGFYVFKHEYVMVFQKRSDAKETHAYGSD